MSTQSRALALGVLALALFAPHTLTAQAVELSLRAFGAAVDPEGGLSQAHILSSPVNVVSYDRLPTLPSVGLGLDLRARELPAVLRLSVERAFAREETGQWGCADSDGTPLPCPSVLILVPTDIHSWQVSGDVEVEIPWGPVTVRPLGGVAWVRHSYEWTPGPAGSFSLDPGSHHDDALGLRYGVGLALPAGPARVEADYVWQHAVSGRHRPDDVGATRVGVSVPLSALR